jgi:hypothetical protein
MLRDYNKVLVSGAFGLFLGSCISWSHVQYMELTLGLILLAFNHQSIGQFLARCFAWLKSQKKPTVVVYGHRSAPAARTSPLLIWLLLGVIAGLFLIIAGLSPSGKLLH